MFSVGKFPLITTKLLMGEPNTDKIGRRINWYFSYSSSLNEIIVIWTDENIINHVQKKKVFVVYVCNVGA